MGHVNHVWRPPREQADRTPQEETLTVRRLKVTKHGVARGKLDANWRKDRNLLTAIAHSNAVDLNKEYLRPRRFSWERQPLRVTRYALGRVKDLAILAQHDTVS